MEEKNTFYPNVWQSIGLTALGFLFTLLYGALIGFIYGFIAGFRGTEFVFDPANNFLQYFLTYILGSILVLGGLSFRASKKKGVSLADIKGNSGNEGILYLHVFLLMAGLSVLVSELDNILQTFVNKSDWYLGLMEGLGGQNVILVFLATCVVAPVFEELFFRGLILRGLLKNIKPWLAILLSAFLFAVFHFNIWQGLGAFILGIMMGWVLYKTGSLYLAIFAHFVNNFIVLLGGQNIINIPGYTQPSATGFQPFWFNIIGLVLFVAGLVLIRNKSDNSIDISSPVVDQ